jgi:hypothetical protein
VVRKALTIIARQRLRDLTGRPGVVQSTASRRVGQCSTSRRRARSLPCSRALAGAGRKFLHEAEIRSQVLPRCAAPAEGSCSLLTRSISFRRAARRLTEQQTALAPSHGPSATRPMAKRRHGTHRPAIEPRNHQSGRRRLCRSRCGLSRAYRRAREIEVPGICATARPGARAEGPHREGGRAA